MPRRQTVAGSTSSMATSGTSVVALEVLVTRNRAISSPFFTGGFKRTLIDDFGPQPLVGGKSRQDDVQRATAFASQRDVQLGTAPDAGVADFLIRIEQREICEAALTPLEQPARFLAALFFVGQAHDDTDQAAPFR